MEFRFVCKHLVLACGANDLHNDLHVKGENSRFILRSIRELEDKIREDLPRLQKDPLLIVGSGLSAADAILLAQKYRIKIIHVIRRSVTDSNLIFTKLPKKTYPEYQRVYEKMLSYRYTNLKQLSTSTSDLSDETHQQLNGKVNQPLRRPLSHNDLNHISTTTLPHLDIKLENSNSKCNYILYDEHQVKCFTSKRTCILVKSNYGQTSSQTSNVNGNGTANNCRHLQLQKQHHQLHQRQLNEFDEELEQSVNCNGTNELNETTRGLGLTTEVNENKHPVNLNCEETEIKISYACILIGFSPDLDFLPPQILNGLAVNPDKMLNTKENPILVDICTHECANYKTLYAMGPLIGDNFVRFGTGGALAITSRLVDYIRKERRNSFTSSKQSSILKLKQLNINNNNNNNNNSNNNTEKL
jgi:hypothetical protein